MRKKFACFLTACVSSVLLAGCGSNPPKNNDFADCVFTDDGKTRAPEWVCGAPFQNVKVYAVGSYEKTGAGVDFQKTMAAASARDALAAQLRVNVNGMVKRYIETTGTSDSETVDKLNAAVSKHITKETLVGSRVYTSRMNPKTGVLYVFVGLDDELAKEYAKQALRTSMNNEKALWQKVQAKKNFDELSEEIAKLQ